jgi:hypothetical protein
MDVLTIMSTHFNSNQAYMTTVLIVARAEKFEVIDTIYTFDEKQCAFERTQGLAFRTVENGKAYGAIEATVTETTAPTGESCDNAAPEPSSRVFFRRHIAGTRRSRATPGIRMRLKNLPMRTHNGFDHI